MAIGLIYPFVSSSYFTCTQTTPKLRVSTASLGIQVDNKTANFGTALSVCFAVGFCDKFSLSRIATIKFTI